METLQTLDGVQQGCDLSPFWGSRSSSNDRWGPPLPWGPVILRSPGVPKVAVFVFFFFFKSLFCVTSFGELPLACVAWLTNPPLPTGLSQWPHRASWALSLQSESWAKMHTRWVAGGRPQRWSKQSLLLLRLLMSFCFSLWQINL